MLRSADGEKLVIKAGRISTISWRIHSLPPEEAKYLVVRSQSSTLNGQGPTSLYILRVASLELSNLFFGSLMPVCY